LFWYSRTLPGLMSMALIFMERVPARGLDRN
jgi:hypothetical protein